MRSHCKTAVFSTNKFFRKCIVSNCAKVAGFSIQQVYMGQSQHCHFHILKFMRLVIVQRDALIDKAFLYLINTGGFTEYSDA